MQGLLPTRRPLPVAFLVVASLLAGTGLAEPASAGGQTITLDASKRQLQPRETTDLSGALSDVFSGSGDKPVTLLASPYPYATEEVAGMTTTDADGDFVFPDIDPKLNTRYRASFDGDVIDGDATSETVQIFRFVRGDLDLEVTRDGFAEARFDFFYSRQVQPEYYVGRRDVNWYFGKTTADRYRRVKRTRFSDTARGVGSDVRYNLPRSRKPYQFFFFPCIEAPARDIGLGNKKPIKCPRSIPARRAARDYSL